MNVIQPQQSISPGDPRKMQNSVPNRKALRTAISQQPDHSEAQIREGLAAEVCSREENLD